MRRSIAMATAAALWVGLLAVPAATATTTTRQSGACPSSVDPERFASAKELRAGNQHMADLGPRPTASPAQEAFIDWLEDRLLAVPGITVTDRPVTIDRQLERGASLRIGWRAVQTAGAVPYASPTAARGPLVSVPVGTPLTSVDVAGKVVVRDAVPGAVQYLLFAAVSWLLWDPDRSFDLTASYERDWLGAQQRIDDLAAAEAGGAAGLVFVHDLPTEQVAGQYAPYPGRHWQLPALYVGADEGAVLRAAAARGESARLAVQADREMATSRTLVATLPGMSDERIIVESHTDGMNAVWDNGPIALLAMAEHLASLPVECRPRTLEFVLTTGHLYLAQAGVFEYAEVLDEQYDDGTVALVVALEHLGAKEWAAAPRTDGGPGRQLEPTGRDEMFAVFATESPVVVATLAAQVVRHDLRRTFLLRGADAPQAAFPPHRSFGGEGGPYRERIVPTLAAISGPWTLFDPAFGLDELVDPELMRRQTLAFTDAILALDDVPRTVLAGADTAYRAGRALTTGADPVPGLTGALGGLLPPGSPEGPPPLDLPAYCALGALAAWSAAASGSESAPTRGP